MGEIVPFSENTTCYCLPSEGKYSHPFLMQISLIFPKTPTFHPVMASIWSLGSYHLYQVHRQMRLLEHSSSGMVPWKLSIFLSVSWRNRYLAPPSSQTQSGGKLIEITAIDTPIQVNSNSEQFYNVAELGTCWEVWIRSFIFKLSNL